MIYLGIDPGARGAIGKIDTASINSVLDLPTSRFDLWVQLRPYIWRPTTDSVFVVLERPGYGPPMGKSAAIKLRESFERCAMALVAAGIPFEEVSPQEWKKMLFKGTEIKKGKEGKAQARARAMELFPSLADQLSRVKDDGRAEALLLAEYARRLRA